MLPTGGRVVAGSATIGAPVNNTLSIQQNSGRAVVNWNGFSIGQPNTVNFAQPGSSAAILNRVTGSAPSTLAGRLNANGQVYLVNPNGVAITRSGTVNVGGGFVASTLDVANRDAWMGGANPQFAGTGASAAVTNAGRINVGPGGYAALIGGSAANSGTISVPLGKVGIGSGERATLDLNGDGFMQVAAPTGAKTAQGQALVGNSGRIAAPGGTVQLRAATVATAIRDAVNMSGVIEANSVSGHNGSVVLGGGPGGNVNLTGSINVSGLTPGQSGGNAYINGGGAVALGPTARIDARGWNGGGTVRIGGGPEGRRPLAHNPRATQIAAGAVIDASATHNGNGGNVAVWSDTTTVFAGTIYAKGGAEGGDGGTVETSSRGHLTIGPGATVAADAPKGRDGSWVLDPADLTIDQASADAISNTLNGGTGVTEETTGSGGGGSGSGDIIVNGAISWNSSATLTLSAFNSIVVNSAITVGGAGGLVLTTNNNVNGASTGNGTLTFTLGQGSAQFTAAEGSGQSLTINGTPYTLLYSMSEVQNINNTLSGNYALAEPLDAATFGNWTPIGQAFGGFTGNFEGLGNTISNLSVTFDSYDAGLFGKLESGASIENLGLINASVTDLTNAAPAVGALVGLNEGTIRNSYATGSVTAGGTAGGGSSAGGLVGYSLGTVLDSYAAVTVVGNELVGGLVGYSGGPISNSFATGAVSGLLQDAQVGGLVGHTAPPTTISNSYATGSTSSVAQSASVGGLVGVNFVPITNSYATGAVSATGDFSVVGGLIGDIARGSIANAFSTGAVAGTGLASYVGGLVGSANGEGATVSIGNTYAAGRVTGTGSVGGFVGASANTTITNAYWNADRAGTSCGVGACAVVPGITGLSGSDVFNLAKYAGFAASTTPGQTGNAWVVVDANGSLNNSGAAAGATMPMLASEYSTSVNNAHQLQLMAMAPAASYTLGGNIDASKAASSSGPTTGSDVWGPAGFVPVGGNGAANFTGTFNGLGNVVTGLTITDATNANVGLFGQLGTGGTVENIGLIGGSIGGGTNSVGALVGSNQGTVSNAYSTAAVSNTGGLYAGGLVGYNMAGGTIDDAYATGTVQTGVSGIIGGLAGFNQGAITNAYATGAVSGSSNATVGGLVGSNDAGAQITNAYAAGPVSATLGNGGGLVGVNAGGISNGYYNQDRTIAGGAGAAVAGTAPYVANSYVFTFTSTPGQADAWVMVNPDGTLATAGSATVSATMPMLAFEAQGTIQNAHQLQLMAMNLKGSYTLGRAIDASATGSATSASTGTDVWGCAAACTSSSFASVGGNGAGNFTGTFDGANLTISNLAVNSQQESAGLFGVVGQTGVVKNVGLLGGSMTSSQQSSPNVGALIGENAGTVSNAYATTSVTNLSGIAGSAIGGLVGLNDPGATISGSHATGAVTSVAGTDGANTGGLVGTNSGAIGTSYATGAVSGGNSGSYIGGLVGLNDTGTISTSFAAGAVSGGTGDNASFTTSTRIGGLVGSNSDQNNVVASITDSYAIGTVTGGSGANVGGLVGYNDAAGTITSAYATGAVSGAGAILGGLVGTNANANLGAIANGYYDAGTTGQALGTQADGSTGMTTAALQAALPSGFSSATWGIVPGKSYPYLGWEFAGGTPQVVSGIVYGDQGATAVGGGLSVAALANGAAANSAQTGGTVQTGANGYYYFLLAPGTLGSGADVLTYVNGATTGIALADRVASGYAQNTNIYGSTLHAITPATAYSTVLADLGVAEGGNLGALPGVKNTTIDASGAFAFDQIADITGTLTVNAFGSITQTSGIAAAGLTARTLANSGAAIVLDNLLNQIAGNVTLSTLTANGSDAAAGTIAFFDQFGFTVGLPSAGPAFNAATSLDTLSTGVVTSGTAILGAAGAIGQAKGTAIVADSLGVFTSSDVEADITLTTGGNNVANLNLSALNGDQDGLGVGNISFSDSRGFTIVTAPSALIQQLPGAALATGIATGGTAILEANGAVSEANNAAIGAQNLGVVTFTAGGAAIALGNVGNAVSGRVNLAALNAIGSQPEDGGIAFNDKTGFTIAGASGPTAFAGLLPIGAGGIATTGTATLNSGGAIGEDINGGAIVAATLTGSSVGDTTLTSSRDVVGTLGKFTAGGNFSFTDAPTASLTVTGPVSATGTAAIGVVNNSDPDMVVSGTVAGTTVSLSDANGNITVGTGAAVGGAATTGVTISASNGNIALQAGSISTTGTLTLEALGGATVQGSLTQSAGGNINETGGTLAAANLVAVTESNNGGGAIALNLAGANTVTGTVTLAALNAAVTDGGALPTTITPAGTQAGGGAISFTDKAGFTIAAATTAVPAGATLSLEAGITTTGTATLVSQGAIGEASGAAVSAGTLTGSSVGGAIFNQTGNTVATFGGWTDATKNGGGSNGIVFANGASFSTAGAIKSPGSIALTADGTLTIPLNASVTATGTGQAIALTQDQLALTGTVAAGSTGSVAIAPFTAGKAISVGGVGVGTLDVTSADIAQITAGTLTIGANPGAGALTVDAPVDLTLTGTIANLTLASGKNIALDAAVTLGSQGTLTLDAGGVVSETGGPVIAGTLTGQSVGGATLTAGANDVATFGPWADTGVSSLGVNFTNAAKLATSGTISSGTGSIALEAATGDLTIGTGEIKATAGSITLTALTGNIGLIGNLTAPSGSVVLNAPKGSVTQDPDSVIDPTGFGGTALGPVSMLGLNTVDTLAYDVTGPGNGFAWRNDNTALTIGTVGAISGITTQGGPIQISTTTGGGITVTQAIASNGGEIDFSVAAGNANALTNQAAINSTGALANGNVVILADQIALAGAPAAAINAGTGTVLLGPQNTSQEINLYTNAADKIAGATNLAQADLDTITAGAVQLGYRKEDGTAGLIADINIADAIAAPAGWNTLLLVTGGASGGVTQSPSASLTVTNLGIIAGAGATLTSQLNSVTTLAGYVDGAGGGFSFMNGSGLTVGVLQPAPLGVSVAAGTGIASSAAVNPLSGFNPLSGVKTASGDIAVNATGGDLTLAANVCAGSLACAAGAANTATLQSGGAISQTGGVIAAATLTGSASNAASFPDANLVAALGGFTTGGDFTLFNTVALTQTAGTTLDAGANAALIDNGGKAFTQSGKITNAASVTIENTAALSIADIDTGAGTVTLGKPALLVGPVTETAGGVVTANLLTGQSSGGLTLDSGNNLVAEFGYTNTVSGNVVLVTGETLAVAGVANTVGNISLTTQAGGALALAGNLTVNGAAGSGGTVTLNADGGISQSAGAITADLLSVTANAAVDLPLANAVNTVAASVTGGNSFDLKNAATLTVGTVGLLSGITTTNGEIVLATTDGDIAITQPLNTVGGGSSLAGSFAPVGLSAAGGIGESGSGTIVAPAVEAIATDAVTLNSNNVLSIAGQVSGANNAFSFKSSADLETDTVTAAAGSLDLGQLSGVTTNNGAITLTTTGALTLKEAVNANNGLAKLGASPGTITLTATGDISQTSGNMTGGALLSTSTGGNVSLTGGNHIGANDNGSGVAQNAGKLAGFAGGDFAFVNTNAGIQVDTIGVTPGLFAALGGIKLRTDNAGAVTVNQPINSGKTIEIAVAAGSGFTNNAANSAAFDAAYTLPTTAGLDTSFGGQPIVVIADTMSLSGGTIAAGTGPVVLAPATATRNVALGAAGSGTLTLLQSDLASISAGALQIGESGSFSPFSGNIDVAGSISPSPSTLLLVTSGDVTESVGPITLAAGGSLGIAAKSATLKNAQNKIGTVAYAGAGDFQLADAQALVVGSPGAPVVALDPDANGFPSPSVGATPLGIDATAGNVAISVTPSGAGIELDQNVTALAAGLTATGDITENGGIIDATNLAAVSAGGQIILSGANQVSTLAGRANGAVTFANSFSLTVGDVPQIGFVAPQSGLTAGGTVTLSTTSGGLTLASDVSAAGETVNLQPATLISQTGGAITAATLTGASHGGATLTGNNLVGLFGPFTNDTGGSLSFTNAIALKTTGTLSNSVGGLTLTTADGANIVLGGDVTAGNVTLDSAGAVSQESGKIATAGTLSGSSVGGATLNGANLASVFSFSNSGGGDIGFTNAQGLTLNAVSNPAGNIAIATTGTGSALDIAGAVSTGHALTLTSASTIAEEGGGTIAAALLTGSAHGIVDIGQSGNNIAALGAFTTSNGDFTLVDGQPNNLDITGAVDVGSGTLVLDTTAAGITEQAGGSLDPGQTLILSFGPVSMTGPNHFDTIAGLVIGPGASLAYNNTNTDLTVGTVLGFSGIVTNKGAVTLTTTGSGKITLDKSISSGTGAVVLGAAGNFINNVGSSAISSSSRWLIYSSGPAGDVFNGLNSGNTAIWDGTIATLPPGSVAQAGDRYLFAFQPTLTVTTTDLSKAYGTDATAAVAGAFSLSGLQLGSPGAYLGDSAASVFSGAPSVTSPGSPANAGVAGSPYAIAAAQGSMQPLNGYAFAFADTGKLTVKPAALTIAADDESQFYGSPFAFTGNEFAATGLKNGETVGSVTLTSAGDTATAGVAGSPYAIVPSNPTGGSFNPANYTISFVNGKLTVKPAALTIAADDESQFYGSPFAFTGNEFAATGLKNGETVGSVTLSSTGDTATAGVAGSPYAIVPSNPSGGSFNPANYTISFVNGKLTVKPAPLTITADDETQVYGSPFPFTGTEFAATGLKNGETVGSVTLTGPGAAAGVAGSPYAIVPSNSAGGSFNPVNYAISFVNGKMTVTAAPLTITADDESQVYGSPFAFTGKEFAAAGLKNNETVGSVTLTSTGDTATAGVAGSPYAIVPSNPTGGSFNPGNYKITLVNGKLTVIPAPLTITADDESQVYGTPFAFTGKEFTPTGLKNGETVGSVTLSSTGDTATAGVAGSPYAIVLSNPTGGTYNPANYLVSLANGQLTVTPATLTATLTGTVGKTYDGTTDATRLTAANYTLSGVLNGDNVALNSPSDGSYGSANVGTGIPVTVDDLALNGGAAGNYVLASTTIAGKIGTISPASLTVAADDLSRKFGQANPPLTFTVTAGQLFGADTLSGSLSTAATGISPAGTYPITQGTLAAPANYQLSFADGTLTILPSAPNVLTVAEAAAVPGIAALATVAKIATPELQAAEAAAADPAQPGSRKAATAQEFSLAAVLRFQAPSCSASGSAAGAPPALFVVLPPAIHGKPVGGVVVTNGMKDETLDQSFAAAELRGGALAPCQVSKSSVDKTFQKAVAARPIVPEHFLLHFLPGSDRLTPQSLREYHDALAEIAKRRVFQVEVVGYTGKLGNAAEERQRSLSEAEAVRRLLTQDKIDPNKIRVAGRGSLNLALPTAEEAIEPGQRQVEIWVR